MMAEARRRLASGADGAGAAGGGAAAAAGDAASGGSASSWRGMANVSTWVASGVYMSEQVAATRSHEASKRAEGCWRAEASRGKWRGVQGNR